MKKFFVTCFLIFFASLSCLADTTEIFDEISLDEETNDLTTFKLKIQKSEKISSKKEKFKQENSSDSPFFKFKFIPKAKITKDEYMGDNQKLSTEGKLQAGKFLTLILVFQSFNCNK